MEDVIDFYIEQGFWIIPIMKGQKNPPFKWQDKPRPDKAKIREYLSSGYDLAVACGSRSGNIVCVDIDDPKLYHKIFGKGTEKETLVVLTGYKGRDRKRHVYFRTAWPIGSKHLQHQGVAIDIQGEGNYAKLPPSLHSERNGRPVQYEFEEVPPDGIKEWKGDFIGGFFGLLQDAIGFKPEVEVVKVDELFQPRGKGERHYWEIRIAAWLKMCATDELAAWETVKNWNRSNVPPLPEGELRYQFKSMWESADKYSFKFDDKPREYFSHTAIEKAKEVFEGDPLTYIVDIVHKIHTGDDWLIRGEYISALSAKLSDIKINSWAIGRSGKGKSHLKYSIIESCLPKELYEIVTSSSPLALFYLIRKHGEHALSDMLLYIDEVEASMDAEPILRSLTGQTEITPRHLSVHENEVIDLRIKGKRTVWFTSVQTFGTEQIKNRFIYANPDESQQQDEDVFELQKKLLMGKTKPQEFDVAKALTQLIIQQTKDLDAVFNWDDVSWPYKEKRWLFPMFAAMVQVIAKVNFKRRQIVDGRLHAEKEDFYTAARIWKESERTTAFRIPRNMQLVLEAIPPDRERAMTHAEIAKCTGYSTRQVSNICLQLQEEGLINADKRQRKGAGRSSWEYWLAKRPKIEEIGLISQSRNKNETNEQPASEAWLTPKQKVNG